MESNADSNEIESILINYRMCLVVSKLRKTSWNKTKNMKKMVESDMEIWLLLCKSPFKMKICINSVFIKSPRFTLISLRFKTFLLWFSPWQSFSDNLQNRSSYKFCITGNHMQWSLFLIKLLGYKHFSLWVWQNFYITPFLQLEAYG